jgi:anti-sigma factor RsiW
MPCAEFEDRLLDYAALARDSRARVNAHVSACAECREFLDALRTVDAGLARQFRSSRSVSAAFASAVRRRVRQGAPVARPSFVPELLDLVGWGATVALIGLMAWWFSPVLPMVSASQYFGMKAAWAAGGVFVLLAFFAGLRSFAELKH